MDTHQIEKTGWTICKSIASELDMAVQFITQMDLYGNSIKDFQPLLNSIPGEWVTEFHEMMPHSGKNQSILETLAYLTGTIFEEDYSKATLAMRELDLEKAIQTMMVIALKFDLAPDQNLSGKDLLIDLGERVHKADMDLIGLTAQPEYYRQRSRDFRLMADVLRGQANHDRFWHWIDRFYYEVYRPWRSTRETVLETLEKQVFMELGARQNLTDAPAVSWLSDKHPLLRFPELRAAVMNQKIRVHFWAEPFGLADAWGLFPGELLVSFAAPGEIFENFYSLAGKLADKTQAIADPTRLVILRLIRYFGMTNTDMAEFLGISRPTVSVHARILREAGLISSTSEGRITKHEIRSDEVHKLFKDLLRFLDLPDE